MEEENEIDELSMKIKELKQMLDKSEDSEEYRQFSIFTQQIQILNKEIQKTKGILRLQKCQRLFEQNQKTSILNKLHSTVQTSPTKSSFISKLSDLVTNYKGKATLHNQLKALLQKEKENLTLRSKLATFLQQRLNLVKGYSEITKKLSEDNDLSKKIKYLEEQIPAKKLALDIKRKELGRLRAQMQELKLFFVDNHTKNLQTHTEELQILSDDLKTRKAELTQMIQQTENEISEAASQKSKPDTKGNYDLNKLELKALQTQLLEKDKELTSYEKSKKEIKAKLDKSLKLLVDKKK